MQIQNHVRFKKRIPCEFQDESGRHIGMALNVFQSGFLVRSRTTPQMGSRQGWRMLEVGDAGAALDSDDSRF